jgi:hypothetical protein
VSFSAIHCYSSSSKSNNSSVGFICLSTSKHSRLICTLSKDTVPIKMEMHPERANVSSSLSGNHSVSQDHLAVLRSYVYALCSKDKIAACPEETHESYLTRTILETRAHALCHHLSMLHHAISQVPAVFVLFRHFWVRTH